MLVQEELKLIGSVAKESGVPIKTIRYYEELGLLQSSGRTEGGFRLFNSDILMRLNFIKRAQRLGLSLLEIKEVLDVRDRGELPCDRVKIQLADKLSEIDEQIQHLFRLKLELEALLSSSRDTHYDNDETICPIISGDKK